MSEKLYTLEEATAIIKAGVKEKLLEGSECPVCTQFVKLYPIKIPATGVRDLIRLYRLTDGDTDGFLHVNDFADLSSRSFAKLAHWDLIQSEINEDTDKRTSGMWTIAAKGKRFVEGDEKVPNRAYIFDSSARAFSHDLVSVQDALGNKFDYEELMSYIA